MAGKTTKMTWICKCTGADAGQLVEFRAIGAEVSRRSDQRPPSPPQGPVQL
ncbi:hypothetical protein Gbem_4114 [Citrifermentans bemidjiense Bem]|uniref:Uncharacterized protein n=1 Tax=Citrifermentans bemidjiense (strain ATCC BAA-1014 / DSM 16622 / JCM 12645 / Bem) TaxID=404380 RepID=E1P6C0_CITBB|nr:hypothetical protein Gbem_4114 [Citrifermentans bemidjiense Bem]